MKRIINLFSAGLFLMLMSIAHPGKANNEVDGKRISKKEMPATAMAVQSEPAPQKKESSSVKQQSSTKPDKGEGPGVGTTVAQQDPEFPGGQDSLSAFLFHNLKQPEKVTPKGQYKHEFVSFTIDKNGKVKDPKIMLSLGDKMDTEALRIVSIMPDWKPATIAGNPVDKEYMLSMDFFVPDKE